MATHVNNALPLSANLVLHALNDAPPVDVPSFVLRLLERVLSSLDKGSDVLSAGLLDLLEGGVGVAVLEVVSEGGHEGGKAARDGVGEVGRDGVERSEAGEVGGLGSLEVGVNRDRGKEGGV
jgi:hypothetical protein